MYGELCSSLGLSCGGPLGHVIMINSIITKGCIKNKQFINKQSVHDNTNPLSAIPYNGIIACLYFFQAVYHKCRFL